MSIKDKIFRINDLSKLVKDGHRIILVDNKLYDVTLFNKNHPGSQKAIIKKCLRIRNNKLIITDCKYDFDFHSKYSHKIWKYP